MVAFPSASTAAREGDLVGLERVRLSWEGWLRSWPCPTTRPREVARACVPSLRTMQFHCIRSAVMNTIIYIVGLVVVVGLVLSFFGLR